MEQPPKGSFPANLNADGTPKEPSMTQEEQDQHTKDVMKEAIKEATSEWLDKQFLAFGKWTIIGGASILLATFLYLVVNLPGFKQALGQALSR